MNLNISNIGVWGFRHYEFLKRNRPSTVGVMRMNGTLETLPETAVFIVVNVLPIRFKPQSDFFFEFAFNLGGSVFAYKSSTASLPYCFSISAR